MPTKWDCCGSWWRKRALMNSLPHVWCNLGVDIDCWSLGVDFTWLRKPSHVLLTCFKLGPAYLYVRCYLTKENKPCEYTKELV